VQNSRILTAWIVGAVLVIRYSQIYLLGSLLIAVSRATQAATDLAPIPTFSEWKAAVERVFKVFLDQEDKLLDREAAKTIPRLRIGWQPLPNVIENERQRDLDSVTSLENCRKALIIGVFLVDKARRGGPSAPYDDVIERSDGFERAARAYIPLAERCETWLGIPHPTNKFRETYGMDITK
jgi:hypothetical protein